MELGAVHCLPDGDTTTIPSCRRIPRHPVFYREAPGSLGGQQTQDVCQGHPMHVRRVPHRQPKVGINRAPGTDIPWPGASGEAPYGGKLDYGVGDGRSPTSRRAVNQDMKTGDGGAACKAP